MQLKEHEIYFSEKVLDTAEFDYPYVIVDGLPYRQQRALSTGGVVCTLAEDYNDYKKGGRAK